MVADSEEATSVVWEYMMALEVITDFPVISDMEDTVSVLAVMALAHIVATEVTNGDGYAGLRRHYCCSAYDPSPTGLATGRLSFEMMGDHAIYHDGWIASTRFPLICQSGALRERGQAHHVSDAEFGLVPRTSWINRATCS